MLCVVAGQHAAQPEPAQVAESSGWQVQKPGLYGSKRGKLAGSG